jgi:peptidoglycan/xylan/chitin deacetylase (PgdA/CDA1 family)
MKAKSVPILMYHSISSGGAPRFRPFAVSPERFAEQMDYLAQTHYTPITVSQLAEVMAGAGEKLPDRPVVITFDDGLADFYAEALPVLRRRQFVATLYILTAYVGGASRWLKREGEAARPMLSWEQVVEVGASGIECGGHTHTHSQLDTLPEAAAYDEIFRCKEILEDHLGRRITSFAYPYGYYSETTRRLVQRAGYSSACAVKFAMSSTADDVFALSRLIVKAEANLDHFKGLLAHGDSAAVTVFRQARTAVWRVVRQRMAPQREMSQPEAVAMEKAR